jgi:hypothetical protein
MGSCVIGELIIRCLSFDFERIGSLSIVFTARRAEAEEASSPPSNASKLPASSEPASEAPTDRNRPSSRHLIASSNAAPGPSGSKRTSTMPAKKPSLENEASSSSASGNPGWSASLPYPFATIPPNPYYATNYPPPPLDHFPLHSHDPSQSHLVSRTSSPGLVNSSLPPHHSSQHQHQQTQPSHPLRYPHQPSSSDFPSPSSGSIPIPASGRSSLSNAMNPRSSSSQIRRPAQQHSPSLGGQASLYSPSLGGSFGRSSRLYHPYGNTSSSMGDASLESVSRRSGSSDGRGGSNGHRQYSSANSFFPAPPLAGDGSWSQQPQFRLPTESPSSSNDPSPSSTHFSTYSFQSGFNSYPSRVTADHLLAQAIRGDGRSSSGGEQMHRGRRGSVDGAGGEVDGGPLSAGSDQVSYACFPSHPSPRPSYPSDPYPNEQQHQEQASFDQQSHHLSGSFEDRPNNNFSRPRFASSAGFPPYQQPEFRHSLPTAPASPDPHLASLPPHQQQQQQFSYPSASLVHEPSASSSNEPYYPPYGYAPNAPPWNPAPHHPLQPFHPSAEVKPMFSQPSSSSFDPYASIHDPHQQTYPSSHHQHDPPPLLATSAPLRLKLEPPSTSLEPIPIDFANFGPLAALSSHQDEDAQAHLEGEGGRETKGLGRQQTGGYEPSGSVEEAPPHRGASLYGWG